MNVSRIGIPFVPPWLTDPIVILPINPFVVGQPPQDDPDQAAILGRPTARFDAASQSFKSPYS